MTTAHTAIVLAAGGSTRLGRPKQLLTRDGEALVHRVARLAIETRARRTIVVVGAHADDVTAALSHLDVVIAVNPGWADGRSASIRRAASVIDGHAGAVLLTVCDQPALQAHHLLALLAGAAASPSRIAATRHGSARGTPVVVPATLLHDWSGHTTGAADAAGGGPSVASDQAIEALGGARQTGSIAGSIAGTDRGLGARLRSVPDARLCLLDAPELCFDIDTPDDLRRAVAMGLIDGDASR